MKVLSGSSNPTLATSIASRLNIPMAQCEITKFGNGEKRIWITDEVRGENIILVQSFSDPVDENIIETTLMLDALERAGARNVNLVIPWMGYSLQDKVFRPGEPIAAKVIAKILSNLYVHRVLLVDLHNSSIPGFFSVPTDHLSALTLFSDYVKDTMDLSQTVIASPDFGGLKRARVFSDTLGLSLVNIDKQRDLNTGKVTASGLHGEVQGKNVVLFDDVIVSGGTVIETAKLLKESGATSVHFIATHGIFSDNAAEKIAQADLDSIIITNSIHHKDLNHSFVTLDVAPVFCESLAKWM